MTLMTLLIFSTEVFAYVPTLKSVEIPSVRKIGMGMAYTAVANDETVLLSNPAGIGIKKKLFQVRDDDPLYYFFPIKFGYSEELFAALLSFKSMDSFFNVGENSLTYSFEVYSPTDFSYISDIWGISFFSRGFANIFNTGDIDTLAYQSKAVAQINVGFKPPSFSLFSDKDFHIGIGGKIMYLLQLEKFDSNDEMLADYKELYGSTTPFTTSSLVNFLGKSQNFFEGIAMGLDFGLLWEIPFGDSGHQINLGVMLENAPTYGFSAKILTDTVMDMGFSKVCPAFVNFSTGLLPVNASSEEICKYSPNDFKGAQSTFLRFNGKFGIAYLLPNYLEGFLSDTVFSFDIQNIGDTSYDFADMYHVGVSTTIFDMSDPLTGYSYRMNVSFGVSQNQFNAGYMVHLHRYMIGYNYFREKTLNLNKVSPRHLLSFAFYF